MNQPRVAVLILGYNHKKTLGDALDAALVQTYPDYTLTYIDNASSDGSADMVEHDYPTVTLIRNEENLGYAGGYDAAVRQAFLEEYDAAVLLNPDTIADKEWLSELVRSAYAAPDIALAQSKVLIWDNGPTDRINTFGNAINFLGFGYCGHYKETDGEDFNHDQDVTYASGSALLIKKEYYGNAISFDTDYFAYLEDQDFGWQTRLAGLCIVASARSKVWHQYDFKKKHLNNFKFYLLERNRLTFLLKFFSLEFLVLIFPALLIMELGVLADSIFHGYFIAKLKSYRDFLKTLPKTLKKRKEIQQNRKKTDSELFPFFSPTIEFQEVDSPFLRLANIFLKGYYRLIEKIL